MAGAGAGFMAELSNLRVLHDTPRVALAPVRGGAVAMVGFGF